MNHDEFYVKPQDVLSVFGRLVEAFDEPFGNSSIIPAYFCAVRAQQRGVKYLLAGDGGDEVFGGNERYAQQQVFRNYFKLPSILRKGVLEPLILNRAERLPVGLFRKAASYIRRANLPDVQRIHSYRYIADSDIFDDDFLASLDVDLVATVAQDHFQRLPDAEVLDRHLYMDMKMTIADNDLVKVNRMADCAHVRVRYPMLDQNVVELGFRIPARLKLKGTRGLRYIFKQAFRDFLPPEILAKKKHGFGLPVAIWFRKDRQVQEMARELIFDPGHLQRGYFKPDFFEKLWQWQLNDETPYYGSQLWLFVMLEAWHRSVSHENATLDIV